MADVTTDDLARFMVGHELKIDRLSRTKNWGRKCCAWKISPMAGISGISISRCGKGDSRVTGLLGDGRSALFQTVFGADRSVSGRMIFRGREVKTASTEQALQLGIGYVPRNRKENGIIKDMNALENASIVTWPCFPNGELLTWSGTGRSSGASRRAGHYSTELLRCH